MATVGDAILPHLAYSRWKPKGARVLAACAKTIVLIGTEKALMMLLDASGYGSDRRSTIVRQVLRFPTVHPLAVPSVQSMIQRDWRHLSPGVRTAVAAICDLSPLTHSEGIRTLCLDSCANLTDLFPLAGMTSLEELSLSNCSSICDLGPLSALEDLRVLVINRCEGVTDLSPLSHLSSLEVLVVNGCGGVCTIAPLSKLHSLRKLVLNGCTCLETIAPLGAIIALEHLSLRDCTNVHDISPLGELPRLTNLSLDGCVNINDLTPLSHVRRLRKLSLRDCRQIRDVTVLGTLSQLEVLDLTNCAAITDIGSLSLLGSLETLCLDGCRNIRGIQGLSGLSSLRQVSLEGCDGIVDLSPLASILQLNRVVLDQRGLEHVPVNYFRPQRRTTRTGTLPMSSSTKRFPRAAPMVFRSRLSTGEGFSGRSSGLPWQQEDCIKRIASVFRRRDHVLMAKRRIYDDELHAHPTSLARSRADHQRGGQKVCSIVGRGHGMLRAYSGGEPEDQSGPDGRRD